MILICEFSLAECHDHSRYCSLVGRLKMCRYETFREKCCQTCKRVTEWAVPTQCMLAVLLSCSVDINKRWENHSICRSFRMMQGYSRPRSDGRLNCVQVLQDSSEHIRYITNIIIHLQLSRMWAVSNRFILYWFLFYTELNFGSHLNVIKIGNTELIVSAIIRSILNMIFSTYTLVWAVFLSFDILTPKVPKFVVTLRLDCHL